MPGPLYLDSRELTAKPELLGDVILALPSDMSATWHGRLVLELLINSGGTVDEIIPQSTDVPLDAVNMTVKSFWKNIYAPGRLNGEAVNSKIWVEVIFGSQSEAPTTPRTPSLVQ